MTCASRAAALMRKAPLPLGDTQCWHSQIAKCLAADEERARKQKGSRRAKSEPTSTLSVVPRMPRRTLCRRKSWNRGLHGLLKQSARIDWLLSSAYKRDRWNLKNERRLDPRKQACLRRFADEPIAKVVQAEEPLFSTS